MSDNKDIEIEGDTGRIVMGTGHAAGTSSAIAFARIFQPLSDDSECYVLVGKIAAEAARIEFLIDQAISCVTGIDQSVLACLTGQMIGPGPRFNALIQACRMKLATNDFISRIQKLSNPVRGAIDRRNRAVHDPWLEDAHSGETQQRRGKARDIPDWGIVPVSVTDLTADLAELRRRREQVNTLVGDLWKVVT